MDEELFVDRRGDEQVSVGGSPTGCVPSADLNPQFETAVELAVQLLARDDADDE
ncbi:hypothetical protein HBB16_12985 [Pseudonocardia sp. MCCB 268]|nr:hypothetical protein [Pseudonocardia cytotoxica]